MSLFDELGKDWKENKGWPSDINTESFKDKNKSVMESLIKIEKKEKNELRLALFSGGLGVIVMIVAGIIIPVMQGALALNPFIVIGATIVSAALLTFIWASFRVVFEFDESKVSRDYLNEAKRNIIGLGKKKGKLGITYTIQLLAGMLILNYGILSQFPETSSWMLYALPIVLGVMGLVIWKWRHDRQFKKEYEPRLSEIDEMLKEL